MQTATLALLNSARHQGLRSRVGRHVASPLVQGSCNPFFFGRRSASTSSEATRWGRVTVNEGERFAVWHHSGKCSIVAGPSQFWSLGNQVVPLELYTANPTEYIRVSMKSGAVEILRGPASVWEDPVLHERIRVKTALEVASNEAVVVYKEDSSNVDSSGKPAIQRAVVRGPTMYVPSGSEWLHRFHWHGTDPDSLKGPVQRKLPGRLRFEKLSLAPDQVYFDIPEVRTRDDALMVVKVMTFVKITDVEKMLDHTQDPVSEFMNALSADIVEFVGSRTFEEYKSDMDKLNALSSYPYLINRARTVGYEVSKVVLRGYTTSAQLQKMHDDAIHKRTELALLRETQTQEQDLKDYKLDRDSARFERQADVKLKRARERQALEHDKAVHQQAINDVEAKSQLARANQKHALELQQREELHRQQMAHKQQELELEEKRYEALSQHKVDLTTYLTAQARGPPHRFIEIGSSPAGTSGETHGPRVHLHAHEVDAVK